MECASDFSRDTRNFPYSEVEQDGVFYTLKMYLLHRARFRYYTQELLFKPLKNPEKTTKPGVDSTFKVYCLHFECTF